ncbi:MAG: hypothetical protein HC840_26565 [Leptolyngbyaceae cyanobacterium RM2_2_4]|nr:hypothetical protein [Leptolyngbyaceae cyanobacterium SM1_4_3]NJO52368.1 hypothetical protein [Leptolyngbyaceae cyanobacterium RM2_2_4]
MTNLDRLSWQGEIFLRGYSLLDRPTEAVNPDCSEHLHLQAKENYFVAEYRDDITLCDRDITLCDRNATLQHCDVTR